MNISGLLITLSGEEQCAGDVMHEIAGHASIECGSREGRYLPAVLEVCDEAERRAVFEWLGALPGVEFVDVVFVSLEESNPIPIS